MRKYLLDIIEKINQKKTNKNTSLEIFYSNLEINVSNVLKDLGITEKYKAFNYLKYAIFLIVENPVFLNSFTKNLYPRIGEKFDASPKNVERSIGYMTYSLWYYAENNENFKKELFGDSKDKPTNSELIIAILNYIF